MDVTDLTFCALVCALDCRMLGRASVRFGVGILAGPIAAIALRFVGVRFDYVTADGAWPTWTSAMPPQLFVA